MDANHDMHADEMSLLQDQENSYKIDENSFNCSPELLHSCQEFGKSFIASLTQHERLSVMADTLSKKDAEKKNLRKKIKRIDQDFSVAKDKYSATQSETQKTLERYAEVSQHGQKVWSSLQEHIQSTAKSLTQFSELQHDLEVSQNEAHRLEEQSIKLEKSVSTMSKSLGELKLTKKRLLEEKTLLANSISPEAFEERKIKLSKIKEKLSTMSQGLVDVQNIHKDTLDTSENRKVMERAQQDELVMLQNKINQSVTEVNHLKLKIEAKKFGEARQIEAVEEKLNMVQELCENQQKDLEGKLTDERDKTQAEVMAIVQKTRCLSENYSARCEVQKKVEHELAKTRAAIWQDREQRKQDLMRAICEQKDLAKQKKKVLDKLKKKIKAEEVKQRKLMESMSSAKKQKTEFKKPLTPQPLQRQMRTNALFSQLRVPPTKPTTHKEKAPSVVSLNISASQAASGKHNNSVMDDAATSILTMSSIEGLDVLESRLMNEEVDEDDF